MHISKLIIKKGNSKKGSDLTWQEYQLEINLTEKDNPEMAKEYGEVLIDSWLKKNGNGEQKSKRVES